MSVRWVRFAILLVAACGGGGQAPDAPAGDGPPAADAPASCVAPVLADAGAVTAPTCTANGIPGSCLDVADCRGSRQPTAGLCAGGASVECCTPRFAAGTACDPNAAPLPNACLAEEPGDAGCPAGMARVAAFCIDRFEAALVSTALPSGSASRGAHAALGDWSPYVAPGSAAVRAVSLRGAVPQAYISQLQAGAACAAAGKRLCSDAEWLRACRGPTMTTYPYGNARQPGVCNDARATHPAVELYGTSDSWIFSHLDSPCLNQEANGLARTGAHAGCVTAEGVFDMMGNVHEWTADPAGTFRGGYYVDTVQNGNGCLYATTAHATSYDDYSTGFRCCAAPSP